MISFRGKKFLIYVLIASVALVVFVVSLIQSSAFTSGVIIDKEILRQPEVKTKLDTDLSQLSGFNFSLSTRPPSNNPSLPDPSELGVFELCGGADREHEPSTLSGNETAVRIIHMSWKSTTLPPRFQFYQKSWCDCFPHWRHFLWTDADNERLVKVHYSWFYERYQSFDKNIFRIDSVRYLYLHRYGGIYTDLDNVCLRPFEKLLLGGPPLSFGDMDGSRSAEGWMYIQNSYAFILSNSTSLSALLALFISVQFNALYFFTHVTSCAQVDVLARGARLLGGRDAAHRARGRARTPGAGDRAVPADGSSARGLEDARLRGGIACVRGASVQPVLVDLERPRGL